MDLSPFDYLFKIQCICIADKCRNLYLYMYKCQQRKYTRNLSDQSSSFRIGWSRALHHNRGKADPIHLAD